VIGGHVEEAEVVVVGLDVRRLEDREAHALEDVEHLAQHQGDRVIRAHRAGPRGEGDVPRLGGDTGGKLAGLDDLAPLVKAGLELGVERVDVFAEGRALVRGQAADAALEAGGDAGGREPRAVELLQRLGGIGGVQREQGRGLLRREVEVVGGAHGCRERWAMTRGGVASTRENPTRVASASIVGLRRGGLRGLGGISRLGGGGR
jgi:hypothetical protein